MSGTTPHRITLPVDRDAWRATRDARRKVLAKVRARRRLAMERERGTRADRH